MLDTMIPVYVHTPNKAAFVTVGLVQASNSWAGNAGDEEQVVRALRNLADTGAAVGGSAVVSARLTLVSHSGQVTALAYGDAIRWKVLSDAEATLSSPATGERRRVPGLAYKPRK